MRWRDLKKSAGAGLVTASSKPPRNDREYLEQKALIEWVGLRYGAHPDLDLLYAVPNGGHRHPRACCFLNRGQSEREARAYRPATLGDATMPTGTLTTNTTGTEIPGPLRAVASEHNTETTGVADRHWTEVYDCCRFAEVGIPLEVFLVDPGRILREQGQEGALESIRAGHLPLLPKQAEIARRLREMEGCNAQACR